MYRRIQAARVVTGPLWPVVERFVNEPGVWLPAPAHDLGGDRWRTTVHVGRLRHDVTVELGPVWTLPDAWIRSVRWTPATSGRPRARGPVLLPTFEGRITLRQSEGERVVTVEAAGHYVPPLGQVGAIADVLGLRHAADLTLTRLTEEIAERLGAPATLGRHADRS